MRFLIIGLVVCACAGCVTPSQQALTPALRGKPRIHVNGPVQIQGGAPATVEGYSSDNNQPAGGVQ